MRLRIDKIMIGQTQMKFQHRNLNYFCFAQKQALSFDIFLCSGIKAILFTFICILIDFFFACQQYLDYKTIINRIQMHITKNKPKIKPLAVGDVMVALINQQSTVDRTQYYREILSNNHYAISEQSQLQQHTNIRDKLPEFAIRDLTHQQLLDYHIKNKTPETAIKQYEILLAGVDEEIKHSLQAYGGRLKEGETVIGELMDNLSQACGYLGVQRNCLNVTINRVKMGYAGIAPKLRKINSIKKVLQITKVWGSAKLPYIISIDAQHPHRYDIRDIFILIEKAEATIKSLGASDSSALSKMLKTLQDKRDQIIQSICSNFLNSIINFTSITEYQNFYNQYILISKQLNLCNNILCMTGIKSLIDANSKKMFNDILEKITVLKNVDLLNESNYLTFYDEIIEEFVIYFRSWHFTTKFHIDQQTGYENLFLENRKNVFSSLSEVLAHSIKFSNKFISLEYKIKLKLCEKFEDYLEAGIKWMGFYQAPITLLKKQVSTKMNKELEQLFTLYNNLIKNMLAKELSMAALEKADEATQNIVAKDIAEFEDIDYCRVDRFLSGQAEELKNLQQEEKGGIRQKNKSNVRRAPVVHLKMSQILIEMISEYLQRSKYLQRRKEIYINKISEHFQFILYSLFQVCTRRHIIENLHTDIKEKIIKASNEDSGIKIGNTDDGPTLKKMNQIWKIDHFQRKYEPVVDFSIGIGNRYEGTYFSGYLDVDRVFNNSDQIITRYMKLLLRLFQDLIIIEKWLIEAIPESALKNVKNGVDSMKKIFDLTFLLFKLVIQNHVEMQHFRLIDSAGVTQKLKWNIKKLNHEITQQYRQYKLKILETFRNNTLLNLISAQCSSVPEMIDAVKDLQVENVFKTLLQIYNKIEKINDNGRQLIRLDYIDISTTLKDIKVMDPTSSWQNWFQKYLELTNQRSYRNIIDKAAKIGILYPPMCWKSQLMWVIGQMNHKQKKQYNSELSQMYYQYLCQGK